MSSSVPVRSRIRAAAGPCLAVLLRLAVALLAAAGARAADFLPPDRAFALAVRSVGASVVELRFDIAPGYYMYRERFELRAEPGGTALGPVAYPAGHVKYDENFQKDVETYRGALQLRVPVQAAPGEFKLWVTSQGCADQGLCYPPRQQAVQVRLDGDRLARVQLLADDEAAGWTPPPGAVRALAAAAPADVAGAVVEDDGTLARTLHGGSLWAVLAAFLAAGVLLSLTPCVLPMLPILSAIVVGRQPASRARALGLAATYSAGMALVYTAFGIAAGLAGEGLAGALQQPPVLIGFALLLVLLALASFGVVELQLPQGWRDRVAAWTGRVPGGRYGGAFAMGGLSALIVSPCVAAPLAGALLYISQTRDVVLGGSALFALACGMSAPLLLLGWSSGALLPRAGPWMEGVRRFFGALLLAMALWIVGPVLPAWAQMVAWGVLLITAAVLLRVFERLPPGAGTAARLAKALGVVLALAGAAQIGGALSGGRDPLRPLAHLRGAGTAASAPVFQRVASVAELDAALAGAGRPVMLDFYADWCVSCKEMEAFTYSDPQVRERLAGMLLLKADVTANNEADRALLKRFGLYGPPGTIFFDARGREIAGVRVIGFQRASAFLQTLGRVVN